MNRGPEGRSDDVQVTDLGGRRRAAVGFVFAVAVMDILAMGIVIPVLPQLVKQFNHGNTARRRAIFRGVRPDLWGDASSSFRRSWAPCPIGSAAGRCC